MNINFHIPDFYTHWQLNINLIDMMKEHPEYFRDNVRIASVYGCFPYAMWNGGRAVLGPITKQETIAVKNAFNERNVPIRFTFTNPLVKRIHLNDSVSNGYAKMAENGFNEIIVNSPELEEHVRRKYPRYPLISSTVKQIRGIDNLIAELKKDYKYVVLDYNWNNDFELLEQIPQEYRSRCEILINAYCMSNCQKRGEHYRILGQYQIDGCMNRLHPEKIKPIDFRCPCETQKFYDIQTNKTFITNDDLFTKYVDMGFENFKIEGRLINGFNVLESYMYYLTKPEYRDKVRLEMLIKPALTMQELVNTYGEKETK